jgi:hypothetical protein
MLRNYWLTLAFASITTMAPNLHADIFNATGTLTNGATLTGTVTIDTTNGTVTALALAFSGNTTASFDQIDRQGLGTGISYEIDAVGFDSEFDFDLPVASLKGYSGGNICSHDNETSSCQFTSVTDVAGREELLANGALTPAVPAVPEPSSVILLATLIGLGAAAISRRNRAPGRLV